MTHSTFHPDDPRLTAFVMGELDDAEVALFEDYLAATPEAQAALEEIKDTILQLKADLANELSIGLTAEQRARIEQAALAGSAAAGSAAAGSAAAGSAAAGLVDTAPGSATGGRSARLRRAVRYGSLSVAALVGIVLVLPAFQSDRSRNNLVDLAGTPPTSQATDSTEVASLSRRQTGPQSADPSPQSDGLAGSFGSTAPDDSTRGVRDYGSVGRRSEGADIEDQFDRLRRLSKDESGRTVSGGQAATTAPEMDSVGRPAGPAAGPAASPAASSRASGLSVAAVQEARPLSSAPESPSASLKTSRPLVESEVPRPADGVARGSSSSPGIYEAVSTAEKLAQKGSRMVADNGVVPTPMMRRPAAVGAVDGLESEAARLQVASVGSPRGFEGEGLREQPLVRYRVVPPQNQPADPVSSTPVSGHESYEPITENNFVRPADQPLSTFSIDVDSASYSNVRRFLERNQLPPANAVRVEELINYFAYDYPQPRDDDPFSVNIEVAACPWKLEHRLVRIGLKGREIARDQRPPTNLVFLLDVSGSMRPANKLPLVKQAMTLLAESMTEDDQIAIVTYAGNAGVRLDATLGSKQTEIRQAIDELSAGGSTNGAGGIRLAYDTAVRNFIQGGANRVILCSDGDFNVGVSSDNELVELIKEKAASGVFLSVFGFGMGNLKDSKLEKLADHGNGQYGYIDNFDEARKVFSEELTGTLYTIAKDVKMQVEFNPATVGAYRLIGYENRTLAARDFNDDTRDAGEIGSGHTVTALYELIPRQVFLNPPGQLPLKYRDEDKAGTDPAETPAKATDELLTLHLRYKKPDSETSDLVADYPVKDLSADQTGKASSEFLFAASVASFGMNLRQSQFRGNWGYQDVLETAQQAAGDDSRRIAFVDLVRTAIRLTGNQPTADPIVQPALPRTPRPPVLSADEARVKAAVDGRYRRLVTRIEVEDDIEKFGAFNDFGHWDGTEYRGHKDLLPGFWVYVYPNWYIWAEDLKPAAEATETPQLK